jgi:hypothetical protein
MTTSNLGASTGTYTIYADPGHAWAAVEISELQRLGIDTKISGYSYREGSTVYLEEDCDLSLFVEAKRAVGELVVFDERFTNGESPIRNYIPYAARK